MPETEDRAPAAGGDERAIQSTIRLVEGLVDALLGQVRRVARQGEAARGLPLGSKKAIRELVGDVALIDQHCAAVLKALGAPRNTAPERERPAPVQSRSEVPAAEDRTPSDHAVSSSEIVRSLAIDLRLRGHPRDEVLRRLEQTFGADRAAEVVDNVFEG